MRTLISGLGCVCALGDNTDEISKNLFCEKPAHSFQKERAGFPFGEKYPSFAVSEKLLGLKKEEESYGYLFLKTAVDEALANAGLSKSDLKGVRVGVCIGAAAEAGFGCFDFYKDWKNNAHGSIEVLDRYIKYSVSGRILEYLGAGGIAQTVITSCAAGSDAIGIGAEWIENSLCDVVIAGACDELQMLSFAGFAGMGLISEKPCKPFDKNRDGANLGEGAGVVILESLRFAAKRKVQKYGRVLGYGNACDRYGSAMSGPDGSGLKKALDTALNQSGISNDKISFINAHAAGFVADDLAEGGVYSRHLENIPVTATKSLTGHAPGAAGAIGACITLLCLNGCKIPKTHNFTEQDENIGFSPVTGKIKIDDEGAAVTSAMDLGGINSVLVLSGQNYE